MDELERKRAADRERQRAHRARKAQAEESERTKMLRARLALLERAARAIHALVWDYEGEQPLGTYKLGEECPTTLAEVEEADEVIRNELDPGRAARLAAEQARLNAEWEAEKAARRAAQNA